MHKILAKSGHDIGGGTAKKPDETRGAASSDGPLDTELLRQIDAWWRAANFLSVGQTYLFDNPLLKKPLNEEHVKPRLVGHWNNV